MDEDETPRTYSVLLTVQCTTTHWAHVSVPVTDDVLTPTDDGEVRLNTEKLIEAAVELAKSPDIIWKPELQTVQINPLQKPSEP